MHEKYDFDDVLLLPNVGRSHIASRSDVKLEVDGAVPIIVANMDSIGTFEVAKLLAHHRLQVAILKDYTADDYKKQVNPDELDPRLLIPTLGLRDLNAEIARIKAVIEHFPQIRMICLDVPNGYLSVVGDAVKKIKDALPSVKLCAGNVVENAGLIHLARAGADVIKVGIGSGGVCLTRKMTGVGCPQFSAVKDLADLARQEKVELVSDGGMTNPGAAAKAFAAGAHYVMAGSYFAGHEETGTRFHGMSSHRSRSDRGEEAADYRASEGREVILKSKGSLEHTMRELLGGLRSTCTYLGVTGLEDLREAHVRVAIVRRQLNRIEGIAVEEHG